MRSCGWLVSSVEKIYLRFLFAILLLIFLSASRSGWSLAQTLSLTTRQIDSLRRWVDTTVNCIERVQACEKLCNWYYSENDTLQLLASLRSFENVARKCGDDENRLYARMWRLACYYNYSMRDSFFTASQDALNLFTQQGHVRYRYEVFRLRVQYYLYSNEFQHALQESEHVVHLAQEEQSSYGLGISHFCMAFVFQLQYAYDKATAHYSEALAYLKQGDPKYAELRLHCIEQMADCYTSARAYSKLDSVNRIWRAEYENQGIDKHDVSDSNSWRLSLEYFYLSCARYWMAIDSLSQAQGSLDTAALYVQGVVGGEIAFLIEKEMWLRKAGFFDSALEVNNQLLAMSCDNDVARSRLDYIQTRAQLLLALGDYRDAAMLYDTILTERSNVFKNSTMHASMELSSILEAERARRAMLKGRFYAGIGVLVAFFSLAIALVLWRKNRQTTLKNRILVEQLERNSISRNAIQKLQLQQGLLREENKERELFDRLETLMREQHPYLDAKLNRDSLARDLSTNSTYLANAIKACRPGVTVGKYIMEWRVAYAANLLSTEGMQVSEIALKSGFVTRATMSRAFNECYGMSPSEYKGAVQSSKESREVIEPAGLS